MPRRLSFILETRAPFRLASQRSSTKALKGIRHVNVTCVELRDAVQTVTDTICQAGAPISKFELILLR